MSNFLLGLLVGVPFTIAVFYINIRIYDYIHKDDPVTKDEWKIM